MYTSIICGERSASEPEKQFVTDQQTALDQFESDSDSVENCFVTGGGDIFPKAFPGGAYTFDGPDDAVYAKSDSGWVDLNSCHG